jgi:hypothetical protein
MRALALTLLASLVFAQAQAHGEDSIVVVVSANSPVQQLSRADISALYLGTLGSNETAHRLRPLDLEDGSARDSFYSYLVNRSRNQLRAYWSRMVFTGKGKPPRAYPPDAIRQALQADPGVIAYLPRSELNDDMRALLTLP